jgi:hypothetical protein
MINFGFSFASITLIILLTFINLQTGYCGSGGGTPLTPYKGNKNITEMEINKIKEKSNYNRIGVLSDSFISADYFMLHRIKEAKALVDESSDKDKRKFHKDFFDCCLAFVFMPNQNDCEYTEKLDDTVDDFNFEKLSVKKLRYNYEKNELHLKGWLTEEELEILENEIWEISNRNKFVYKKIRPKVKKLFFISRIRDSAYFYIEGTLPDSEKKIKIYLGDIDKIKFLRFDKENYSALLEIAVLPKISPKNLLSIQPSYSYLKAHHKEIIKLRVDWKNKKNEDLFIGEIINCDNQPETCFPSDLGEYDKSGKFSIKNEQRVADITENMELVLGFMNNDIWWAIPSVIKDDDYPYWVIFAE